MRGVLTPTELKAGSELAVDPGFSVLFARVRDRVATLANLYRDCPIEANFQVLGEFARQVRTTYSAVRQWHFERFSTRTGQRHPIGGFTGVAEYEGDLDQLVGWLKAGEVTGVGRQTTWGKGHILIEFR